MTTGNDASRISAPYGRDEDLVSNETGVALPTTAAAYRALVRAQYGNYAPQVLARYPLSRYYSPYLAFRTDPPPNTQTVPAGAQHASDPWDLTPTTGLDANMQALQQQEIGYVTTFGRTAHPTALHTPIWPEFRTGNIMSLAPGGDSESMSIAELRLIHNCGFWDRIAPQPARAG